MRLLHGNEMHFVRCPDGRVYSPGVATYAWWTDYLRVFSEVRVLARVRSVPEVYPEERLAEGPGVYFEDLPDFRGPEEYLLHSNSIQRIARDALHKADAFIFRVPGTIGYLAAKELVRRERPYAFEVVGDPYDVFAPGSVRHPLRGFFRLWHTRNLRTYCQAASATMYVTEEALQRRYPPGEGAYSVHYSDVKLTPDVYVPRSRVITENPETIQLIFVGTLEQLYKAPDVLIDAVHLCAQKGINLRLTFAGDGACRPQLEAQVANLELSDRIHFAGHVGDRSEIIRMLDASDIFVLPSRAEGLPRAMMEAMARALPCIGSSVDGIPELLDAADLVPPDNAQALADKIREVALDHTRRSRMSDRNLQVAQRYRREIMLARKEQFLHFLQDISEHSARRYAAA